MHAKAVSWGLAAAVVGGVALLAYRDRIQVGDHVAFFPEALLPPVSPAAVVEAVGPGAKVVMLVQGMDGSRLRGTLAGVSKSGVTDVGVQALALTADAKQAQRVAWPPTVTGDLS